MQIHISPTDGVPIYLQIVNQVKYLVSSGRLAAGEELPPIRTLAEKLLVNPNTVARAYRELEHGRASWSSGARPARTSPAPARGWAGATGVKILTRRDRRPAGRSPAAWTLPLDEVDRAGSRSAMPPCKSHQAEV